MGAMPLLLAAEVLPFKAAWHLGLVGEPLTHSLPYG